MEQVAWSIVVPFHNEAAVVDEVVRRILRTARKLRQVFELVAVDDGSADGTGQRLTAWKGRDARVQPLILPSNIGQFAATQAGIRASRGAHVLTLDGDLQDPPEHLLMLATRLHARADVDVVFAAKASRRDATWMRAASTVYRQIQRMLCGASWPGSVGSYAAMRRPMAEAIAACELRQANLAAVLVAEQCRWDCVPYEREARTNGSSRVGLLGLIAEAVGSWHVVLRSRFQR